LAKYFGQDIGSGRVLIRQKIGQSELAAMTGVVRETLNRILNDWKRCRVVSQFTDYYCLENRTILQNEADRLDGACCAWLSPVQLGDVPFADFQLSQMTPGSAKGTGHPAANHLRHPRVSSHLADARERRKA
jgi:hypothetical protein